MKGGVAVSRVWGLVFGVSGFGFLVSGWSYGCRVGRQGLRFRVEG